MPGTPALALSSYRRQNLLAEFASLGHVRLQGIYVSLTQGDPTLWSGVLFVRKGPYAPAVLRFKVSFSSSFPLAPPLVLFAADVFHPLLTPLTTITYTTGLSEGEAAHGADQERLPPGALSLRHGFPQWFDGGNDPTPTTKGNVDEQSVHESLSAAADFEGVKSSSLAELPVEEIHVVDVLRYVRRCFEEEDVLDSVPFEAAGNPGAWYGWRAHRAKGKSSVKSRVTSEPEGGAGGGNEGQRKHSRKSSSVKGYDTPNCARRPSEWNWDGVWEERVKKAVQASLAEPALFGAGASRDEIRFQKGFDDGVELESVQASMRQHLQGFE